MEIVLKWLQDGFHVMVQSSEFSAGPFQMFPLFWEL